MLMRTSEILSSPCAYGSTCTQWRFSALELSDRHCWQKVEGDIGPAAGRDRDLTEQEDTVVVAGSNVDVSQPSRGGQVESAGNCQ